MPSFSLPDVDVHLDGVFLYEVADDAHVGAAGLFLELFQNGKSLGMN